MWFDAATLKSKWLDTSTTFPYSEGATYGGDTAMTAEKWVSIVFEVNCYQRKRSQATLWMFPRKLGKDFDEHDGDVGEFPGAIKVIGPVDDKIAEQANTAIIQVLTEAGVLVNPSYAADD
jgi:hypothetical protein